MGFVGVSVKPVHKMYGTQALFLLRCQCCRQQRLYRYNFYFIHTFYTIFIAIPFRKLGENICQRLLEFLRLWWMQMATKKMMTARMITTSSQPVLMGKIPQALNGTEIEV